MNKQEPEEMRIFYNNINGYEFFKILDSFSGGYFIKDLEKGEMHYSLKWKKRLGIKDLPPGEVEAATMTLIHPDDVADMLEIYEEGFARKSKKIKMEFRIKTVDSGFIWAHMKANIQYNEEGKPVKVFGVYIDITEPKRAGEALESQANILTSIRDAVVSIDDKYCIKYWNHEAEKLFGFTAGEVAGRFAKDVLNVETPGLSLKKAASMMTKDRFDFGEVVCRHKSGKPVLIEASGRIIKDKKGCFNGAIVSIRDLSERKNAERKINRQNEIMRLINKVYEKSVNCSTQQELGIECLRIIDTVLNSGVSFISEVNRDGDLRFITARINGCEKQWDNGFVHPGLVPFFKDVLGNGKSILINNISGHPEGDSVFESHIKFDSFLGTPFVQKGKVLGLIGAANKEGGFKEEDRELFEAVTPSVLEVLQRKRTEEELKKSEKKYRTMIETAGEGIVITHPDGKCIYANQRIADMLGYPVEELIGKTGTDFSSENNHPQVLNDRDTFHKGDSLHGEFRFRRSDGSQIWTMYNCTPVFNEKGEHTANFEMYTDITAMRKSEEKYRELVESSTAGIYKFDLRVGRFTSVNNAICKATGYSREELLKMDPAALLDEKSAKIYRQRVDQLTTGTEPEDNVDYKIISKDGKEIYGQFRIKFVKDKNGVPVEISVTVNDITERIRMEDAGKRLLMREKALRELMSRLLETEDPSEIMKEICDESARYMDCDVYFSHIIDGETLKLNAHSGMSKDQIKSMEKFEYGEAVSGTVALDGSPIIACDIQRKNDKLTRKARRFGLRSMACFPLKAGGRVIGTLSFGNIKKDNFSDDEISFMETVSGHIALALSRVLITRELKESKEQALNLVEELRKNASDKDNFLSAVSHELRNPLATISAGLQLLKASGDTAPADSVMEIINRQMNHLCCLADDLIELTRIKHNKMSIRKQRIDINGLMGSVAKDHETFFREKEVILTVLIEPGEIYVEADPNRIGQATGNLLHNAAKYSNKGGHVVISVRAEGSDAVISVSDSGIGIKEEFLPYIFEPFSQADTSLDRHDGGLGLGLSITKGIVELHGGNIIAKSAGQGKGSEFIIRLPLAPSCGDYLNEDKQTIKGTFTLKVLIIEDNKDYAEVLSALLNSKGHKTYISYDGIDGIERAKEIYPDIIICDIGLPGMNGYEVAKAIRNNSILEKVFLVALSGYWWIQHGEDAKEAGFDRYLTKPAEVETLDKIIEGVYEKNNKYNRRGLIL